MSKMWDPVSANWGPENPLSFDGSIQILQSLLSISYLSNLSKITVICVKRPGFFGPDKDDWFQNYTNEEKGTTGKK